MHKIILLIKYSDSLRNPIKSDKEMSIIMQRNWEKKVK